MTGPRVPQALRELMARASACASCAARREKLRALRQGLKRAIVRKIPQRR